MYTHSLLGWRATRFFCSLDDDAWCFSLCPKFQPITFWLLFSQKFTQICNPISLSLAPSNTVSFSRIIGSNFVGTGYCDSGDAFLHIDITFKPFKKQYAFAHLLQCFQHVSETQTNAVNSVVSHKRYFFVYKLDVLLEENFGWFDTVRICFPTIGLSSMSTWWQIDCRQPPSMESIKRHGCRIQQLKFKPLSTWWLISDPMNNYNLGILIPSPECKTFDGRRRTSRHCQWQWFCRKLRKFEVGKNFSVFCGYNNYRFPLAFPAHSDSPS